VAKSSSQKFVARNRAPRVQIEYDVETNGAQKKIEIPFVMGVLSDLSGKTAPDKPIDERKALEIDAENFNSRLKAMQPRVTFAVPNKLSNEGGSLGVDITFESLDDFSPAAIAKKVEPLRKLLEARTQLSNLVSYMDGKAGAEDLITKALNDPELLKSLAALPKPADPAGDAS